MRSLRISAGTSVIAWLAGLWTIVAISLILLSVPASDSLIMSSLILVQAVTGTYIASYLVGELAPVFKVTPPALVGIGLGIGTALAALTGALATQLGVTGPVWLAPTALAAAHWVLNLREQRSHNLSHLRKSELAGVVFGLFAGLASMRVGLRKLPLPFNEPALANNPDMVLFERLATVIGNIGVLNSSNFSSEIVQRYPHIFLSDGSIQYHWLAYGWAGQLAASGSTASFAVLTRLVPVITLVGVLLMVTNWVRNLDSSRFGPIIAAGVAVTGGYVGATTGALINLDSPSQTLSILWLTSLLFLVVAIGSGASTSWGFLIVTGVLSSAALASKASTGLVAFAGVMGITAFRLRGGYFRTLRLSFATSSGMAIAYLVFFRSPSPNTLRFLGIEDRASTGQGLDPFESPIGIALGTLLLIAAIIPRWIGALWWSSQHESSRQESSWMTWALALVGLAPIVFFAQGTNELWFASAVGGPISPVVAAGFLVALRHLPSISWRLGIVAAGAILIPITGLLWSTGPASDGGLRPLSVLLPYVIGFGSSLVLANFSKSLRVADVVASNVVLLTTVSLGGRLIVTLF